MFIYVKIREIIFVEDNYSEFLFSNDQSKINHRKAAKFEI